MNNKNQWWLEGVRARVNGWGRIANPYATLADSKQPVQWYAGWDTADIILSISNVKEPA